MFIVKATLTLIIYNRNVFSERATGLTKRVPTTLRFGAFSSSCRSILSVKRQKIASLSSIIVSKDSLVIGPGWVQKVVSKLKLNVK